MRHGISFMLALSLALHATVGLGAMLILFPHPTPAPKTKPEAPIVLELREELKALAAPVAVSKVHPSISGPLVSINPPPLVPATPIAAPIIAAPARAAVEPNPNAHAKPLPPEQVLNPTPPPVLNASKGVVFVLDISGSMYEPYAGTTRLAYARKILGDQIRALADGTPFAITLYAQRAVASGPLVAASAATRDAALRFIQHDVDCGGGTNLPEGFAAAERLQAGRLILATDGDLNISAPDLMARTRAILGEAGHGPALTVISIAPRADTNAERLLQDIADQQGGAYFTTTDGSVSLITSAANAATGSAGR